LVQGDHILSQKLLVVIDTFTNKNKKLAMGGINPLHLLLSPLASLLFTLSPWCHVHTIISQLFNIENYGFAIAEVLRNLHMVLSRAELYRWESNPVVAFSTVKIIIVMDKGNGEQPACPEEWKMCKEEHE
jgi:hypothetical protein